MENNTIKKYPVYPDLYHLTVMFRVFIAIIALMSAVANASEKHHFHVGVEDIYYYPVMDFTGSQHKGLLYDVMQDFGRSHDISFEFIPLPLLRFPYWFEENSIDLRLPDNTLWSEKRTPGLHYSDTIISLCDTTVVLAKNRDILIDDVKRLGLLKGFTPAKKWQPLRKSGKVTVAKDHTVRSLTRMLLNGFVDAIDVHIATIRNELKALNLSPDIVSTAVNIPSDTVTYHLSTRHHPEIIQALNEYLTDNRDTINKMANAYGLTYMDTCSATTTN